MKIVFETHSTSLDNEAGVASGHIDVDLSPLGVRQGEELGARRRNSGIEIVYASDLRRSWRTAEIAFGGTGIRIVRDVRLRECDYGEMSGRTVAEIEAYRVRAVHEPFPGGESYTQAAARLRAWLDDVGQLPERRLLVIGHRATFYTLEHLLRGVPLERVISAPFEWRPGWVFMTSAGV